MPWREQKSSSQATAKLSACLRNSDLIVTRWKSSAGATKWYYGTKAMEWPGLLVDCQSSDRRLGMEKLRSSRRKSATSFDGSALSARHEHLSISAAGAREGAGALFKAASRRGCTFGGDVWRIDVRRRKDDRLRREPPRNWRNFWSSMQILPMPVEADRVTVKSARTCRQGEMIGESSCGSRRMRSVTV